MKRALEDLKTEKDVSEAKAARVKYLEELVTELKQANRSLEDKIARLCEAPFISDAFGQHEAKLKYDEALREKENLQGQIGHLQEAVRTNYSALNTLKQQAAQLREEKEELERVNEEQRLKLKDLETGANDLTNKLKLYTGEDGIDIETLERALTIVKRRNAAIDRLPFLEDPENESLITLPMVKRKLEDYQILNLRLAEENERLENMLKMQTVINKDLHKEVEALIKSRENDKTELTRKNKDFEVLALTRLDKIHTLEAQLRQLTYGLTKKTKDKKFPGNNMDKLSSLAVVPDEPEEDDTYALLSQLMIENGEINPDENILEVWVKSATIVDEALPPGASTFVIIDFFDFESQTTSLISGIKPTWDFAATYKVAIDDFLLRFFATDCITFELNMVSS